MTTQKLPSGDAASFDSDLAIHCFNYLHSTGYPIYQKSKHQRSAIEYTKVCLNNPMIGARVCEVAGKVAIINATFNQSVDRPVTLFGSCNDWKIEVNADEQTVPNFLERTFTFHVPQKYMDDIVEFELTALAWNPQDETLCQTENKHRIDLSTYGHFAMMKVSDISFAVLKN